MNDYVRKKALAYRRKFNTSDPFKLADALGIEVMTCDIGSRLGCYMYLKRSKCIWISESLEGNERMFVMAHELGHAIGLDHTDEKSVMQPAGSFYGIQEEDVERLRKLYETNE